MNKPIVIWRLIDGKHGHENQSAGLVHALSHLVNLECIDLSVDRPRPKGRRPDMIIGAGHRTHWKLLLWSIRYRAKSVVLMKPSLPMGLFNLCLVPEHDLKEGFAERSNLIPTIGVLNRVVPGEKPKPSTGLILIGGASKEYNWDGESLQKAIETVVREDPSITWLVTDSRRTEPGFLMSLNGRITKYPHAKTDRSWLPKHLAAATKCWVTEDSVSMVYEALSSGAYVGLLPMPRKGKPGRVTSGIDQLVEQGTVVRYGQKKLGQAGGSDPTILREANRCAELLVEKFKLSQKQVVP